MGDPVLDEAQKLVEEKGTGFRSLRAKGLGFTLAQLALAEVIVEA